MRIKVPTVNDFNTDDFDYLFTVVDHAASYDPHTIVLDFSKCRFLRQNAVAVLGGVLRLHQQGGGRIEIAWDTLDYRVLRNLQYNGFAATFGGPSAPTVWNTIPYREDRHEDKDALVDYLKRQWLGRDWLNISPLLRDAIVGTVYEVYANAFEHSKSPIGVVSCGQYYPNLSQLSLSCVDFGVGIPCNVQGYIGRCISEPSALKWAFTSGHTTNPGGTGRGLGLDILKGFVQLNRGRLEIFSSKAYGLIDSTHEEYTDRKVGFRGTLVNITLQCQPNYYILSSEMDDEPLF